MESKQSLETLPIKCLVHIFAELTFPELLVFRTLSRQLKAVVDKHFRSVDTLPVILSCPNSRSNDSSIKAYVIRNNDHFGLQFGDDVAFGPPSLGWTLFDDERILDKQSKHFLREDFVIVHNAPTAIDGFIEFISKYMPSVTKLGLIIDYAHDWNHIKRILKVYQKQLQVVLLEQTLRSIFQNEYHLSTPIDQYSLVIPEWFLDFFYSLEVLEELYFFPKKGSQLHYGWTECISFITFMMHKLRVFHLNGKGDEYFGLTIDSSRTAFENLEEMFCLVWRTKLSIGITYDPEYVFPKLKTLIVDRDSFKGLYPFQDAEVPDEFEMPNLEKIYFNSGVSIDPIMIKRFNNFPKLERISCYRLQTIRNARDVFGRIVETPVNRTIKHIAIETKPNDILHFDSVDRMPIEDLLFEAKSSLRYFPSLETVTIREPYMKLTREELRDL